MEMFENQENKQIEEQTNIEKEIQTKKQRKVTHQTSSWLFHLLSIFGMFFLITFFISQIYLTPINVVGWSMLPNINTSATSENDTVHVDTVLFRKADSYTYGDVIIISNEKEHYITNTETTRVSFLIKRVIACPGDTITFYLTETVDNKCFYDIIVTDKNGHTVNIDDSLYRKEKMFFYKNPHTTDCYGIFEALGKNTPGLDDKKLEITVSNNCYFAMGDNRNNSTDSRFFGEINYNDICGNVRLQIKYGQNIWIAIFEKLIQSL